MMRSYVKTGVRGALIAACALLCGAAAPVDGGGVTFYFARNPPIACWEGERLGCLAGSLAVAAAERAGIAWQARELPWPRAELSMRQMQSAFFLATPRTVDNEDLFDWFFPILRDEIWLLGLAQFPGEHGAHGAHRSWPETVAVRRGSPAVGEALRHGYLTVEFNDWAAAIRLLSARHASAILSTRSVILQNLEDKGLGPLSNYTVTRLGDVTWYIVRPRGQADGTQAQALRKTLREVEASPDFQRRLRLAGFDALYTN